MGSQSLSQWNIHLYSSFLQATNMGCPRSSWDRDHGSINLATHRGKYCHGMKQVTVSPDRLWHPWHPVPPWWTGSRQPGRAAALQRHVHTSATPGCLLLTSDCCSLQDQLRTSSTSEFPSFVTGVRYSNCCWADAAAGSTISKQVLQGLPQQATLWAEVPCEGTTTNRLLPSSAHTALLDMLHLAPWPREICASRSESSHDLCGLFKK